MKSGAVCLVKENLYFPPAIIKAIFVSCMSMPKSWKNLCAGWEQAATIHCVYGADCGLPNADVFRTARRKLLR